MTIEYERLERLRATMTSRGAAAVLTADPINVFYATGVRNMTIYSMMGAFRFTLVFGEGPVVLWEFPGCEHLVGPGSPATEVRAAPGLTAVSGPTYRTEIDQFASQVVELLRDHGGELSLAVEGFDHPVTDGLRRAGIELTSATEVFIDARRIKTPLEVDAMWNAMSSVTGAVRAMVQQLEPGRSEVEVWAEFHRALIADNGEYVSTRLAQSGERTFPYFNEAGSELIAPGEMFCLDTDAIGPGGYGVDFSRTLICGDVPATPVQERLLGLASEQASHNGALLGPGRDFESFARAAWTVPEKYQPFGYYCLAHGLGLNGEYPYIPVAGPDDGFPLDGVFEPGMVMCIESYIGDPDSHQGVKVEDQYLITEAGAELMSTMPHDPDT